LNKIFYKNYRKSIKRSLIQLNSAYFVDLSIVFWFSLTKFHFQFKKHSIYDDANVRDIDFIITLISTMIKHISASFFPSFTKNNRKFQEMNMIFSEAQIMFFQKYSKTKIFVNCFNCKLDWFNSILDRALSFLGGGEWTKKMVYSKKLRTISYVKQ
jgi:hypothetical protein